MRLKSLYVKDFRSIDGEVNISLDAPIVLIHGPNGAGQPRRAVRLPQGS